MGEQIVRRPGERWGDMIQNDHYTPATMPWDTARDFSKPETIDPEEYEAATGKKHPATLAKGQAAETANAPKE